MPTVLRLDGYTFKIYPNDHTPAHVHVWQAENEARVTLVVVEVQTNIGFNTRELTRILNIVEEHQDEFLDIWDQYHPNR